MEEREKPKAKKGSCHPPPPYSIFLMFLFFFFTFFQFSFSFFWCPNNNPYDSCYRFLQALLFFLSIPSTPIIPFFVLVLSWNLRSTWWLLIGSPYGAGLSGFGLYTRDTIFAKRISAAPWDICLLKNVRQFICSLSNSYSSFHFLIPLIIWCCLMFMAI